MTDACDCPNCPGFWNGLTPPSEEQIGQILHDLAMPLPVYPQPEDHRHSRPLPMNAPDSEMGDAMRLAATARILILVREELRRRQQRAN